MSLAVAGLVALFVVGSLVVRRALKGARKRHSELQATISEFVDALSGERERLSLFEEDLADFERSLSEETQRFVSRLEEFEHRTVAETEKLEELESSRQLIERLLEVREAGNRRNPGRRIGGSVVYREPDSVPDPAHKVSGQPLRQVRTADTPPRQAIIAAMGEAAEEIARRVASIVVTIGGERRVIEGELEDPSSEQSWWPIVTERELLEVLEEYHQAEPQEDRRGGYASRHPSKVKRALARSHKPAAGTHRAWPPDSRFD